MGETVSVLILGYGEMGHAMEYLLSGQHPLHIWDKFPSDGFQSVDLDECVTGADVVLFCLPVNPHREVAERIRPLLREHSICISIAKGLDEQGRTAAQIFEEVLQDRHYALLYGPMISEEIRCGRYAFAQLGCSDDEVYQRVSRLFSNSRLFVEQSRDIAGISWSVILKNVYAILFGIADGLQLGDNTRGYLMVASLRELEKIVIRMGGETASPYHLAGLGDLVTTATSQSSHHHELGRLLARGETGHISGEGVHTLQMVEKHRLLNTAMYPLFELIQRLVAQPEQAAEKIDAYIQEQMGT